MRRHDNTQASVRFTAPLSSPLPAVDRIAFVVDNFRQ
jgi:hypothetical protein